MKNEHIENQLLYILDDDEHYALLLQKMAEKLGWQVVNEQSASKFLENDLPEQVFLVLDLIMPEIDGIEVIRALISRPIELSLILISGVEKRTLHSAQVLAEAYNINVVASLTKPVSMQNFKDVLRKSAGEFAYNNNNNNDLYTPSIAELKRAILEHQIEIYYQPQVSFTSNKILGVEALIRWNHPTQGLVPPNKFIPLAEKQGLIKLFTNEVVSLVARDCGQLQAIFELDTSISINISANDITSLSLPEQLNYLLEEHQIKPGNITFEITESAVMNDLVSFLDVLNRLSLKGFSLSIDDFGTGFSSLSLLYQAPFSELKIDQSFVGRMLEDPEALIIVEVCILLAKKMNMKTIAEGIETKKVWCALKDLGCDVAQGYFICRPMSLDKIKDWYKGSPWK